MITGNIYVVGAYYTCSERLTKTECVCFLQLLDSEKLCPFFIAYMMGFNWSFLNKNNKTEEHSDKISQHALWTSRAFHHSGNPVSPMLRRFLQQVFVMCNCKCDYHCSRYGRCDEEHQSYAHGAIAINNWKISSGSVTGQMWCLCQCKCTWGLTHRICAAKQIKKSRASRFGVSCKTTHVEVLLLMFLIIYILSK